jgi:hypothetical protein
MRWLASAVFVVVATFAWPVSATDKFEIQVYEGDHNEPWQPSLELHTNYTLSGHTQPSYSGETPADRALRLTLEPALGITDWLEVGAYLQSMVSPSAGGQFAGWKLRAKFIVPERFRLPLRLGINIEIGRVPLNVEEEGWANEFRPIVGFDVGRFSLTVNPIFGFGLTGPDAFKPDFEPALKARWNTNLGFAVGVEHYASLGRFERGFDVLSKQEHLTFVAFDLAPRAGAPDSPWELNVALGKSLTDATPQHWILKAIVGHSF